MGIRIVVCGMAAVICTFVFVCGFDRTPRTLSANEAEKITGGSDCYDYRNTDCEDFQLAGCAETLCVPADEGNGWVCNSTAYKDGRDEYPICVNDGGDYEGSEAFSDERREVPHKTWCYKKIGCQSGESCQDSTLLGKVCRPLEGSEGVVENSVNTTVCTGSGCEDDRE